MSTQKYCKIIVEEKDQKKTLEGALDGERLVVKRTVVEAQEGAEVGFAVVRVALAVSLTVGAEVEDWSVGSHKVTRFANLGNRDDYGTLQNGWNVGRL